MEVKNRADISRDTTKNRNDVQSGQSPGGSGQTVDKSEQRHHFYKHDMTSSLGIHFMFYTCV